MPQSRAGDGALCPFRSAPFIEIPWVSSFCSPVAAGGPVLFKS